jgi:hypothetical protein
MKRASDLIDQLVQEIIGYRFSFMDEEELQMGVERVLQHVNAPYTREYRLSEKDRLDFFVPIDYGFDSGLELTPEGIAIEVKINGTLTDLTMQVHRYMQSEVVLGTIVITPKMKLIRLPAEMNGKPLAVAHLASSAF